MQIYGWRTGAWSRPCWTGNGITWILPQDVIWKGFDLSKRFHVKGAMPWPLECRGSSKYANILMITEWVAGEAWTAIGDFIGVLGPCLKVSPLWKLVQYFKEEAKNLRSSRPKQASAWSKGYNKLVRFAILQLKGHFSWLFSFISQGFKYLTFRTQNLYKNLLHFHSSDFWAKYYCLSCNR